MQVPTFPGRVHMKQAPEQAVSQHTPSTQFPERQSVERVHVQEFGRRPVQVPNAQWLPATHAASSPQELGQDAFVPSQR